MTDIRMGGEVTERNVGGGRVWVREGIEGEEGEDGAERVGKGKKGWKGGKGGICIICRQPWALLGAHARPQRGGAETPQSELWASGRDGLSVARKKRATITGV
jgi:hypothetical protein